MTECSRIQPWLEAFGFETLINLSDLGLVFIGVAEEDTTHYYCS